LKYCPLAGAVGTPVWFGFEELDLGESTLQKTGFAASVLIGINAYVIPVVASSFLLSFQDILRNSLFILLSISSCVVPAVCISLFSYEFPSIVGALPLHTPHVCHTVYIQPPICCSKMSIKKAFHHPV
jgi:L-lactate permease